MKWGWIQEKVQKLLPEPKWNQFLSSSDFSHILHDIKIRTWPNLFSATHGSRISKVNVDNCNVLLKGIVSIGSFLWSFVWKTNSFFTSDYLNIGWEQLHLCPIFTDVVFPHGAKNILDIVRRVTGVIGSFSCLPPHGHLKCSLQRMF